MKCLNNSKLISTILVDLLLSRDEIYVHVDHINFIPNVVSNSQALFCEEIMLCVSKHSSLFDHKDIGSLGKTQHLLGLE